jgi:hypothetical protein
MVVAWSPSFTDNDVSARAAGRIVAVGIAFADRAVLVVDDMLGLVLSRPCAAGLDRLFFSRVGAAELLAFLDFVDPLFAVVTRVDEPFATVRSFRPGSAYFCPRAGERETRDLPDAPR